MRDPKFSGRTDESTPERTGRQVHGERRVITMLFCDVADSTAMADNLDPEEWAEIMNEAFEYMVAPIYRYEGTVARLMGDGFLAFFGAPISHEDDPQRAVYAGLEILADIAQFRTEIKEDYGLEFNLRVGINTGPVVVGQMGSDTTVEYTAMGDAINVASRMETTAAPGTLQISADTYDLVAPLIEVDALGPIDIKGKDESINIYRVLGRKKSPGRLRGIKGLDSPLIGRALEFEQLSTLLDQLQNGRGGIHVLIGEAGLGKSRLIEELRKKWRTNNNSEASWTESHGLPYERTRPYSLFHQRMRSNLELLSGDSADVVREKIALGLEGLPDAEQASFRRAIETMLAVEETNQPQTEAEALQRDLYNAMYQAWYEACLNRPSVAVFDDLHWCDPASIDLLLYLASMIKEVPLFILCAQRPERDSTAWRLKTEAEAIYPAYYSDMVLSPLENDDSQALVSSLLTIADLPQDLRRLIIEKSEGNPFFIEEIIRTMIDTGVIEKDESSLHWQAIAQVHDIDIPENLQALLISRIDRLEQQSKETLQLASVIGRRFYHRILEHIAGQITALPKELQVLQEVDLIREISVDPEIEYSFRHELTRDAAYKTILRRQRRRYHRRVGEAIETIFSERIADEAHNLAYHFELAGDASRALKYYSVAGERAAGLYANEQALDYFERALVHARDISGHEELIHIYLRRGRIFEVCGQYDDAMANYQELRYTGVDRQDGEMELEALVAQATLRSTYTDKFDPQEAAALSKLALKMAQKQNNHRAEAKIYWNKMLANTFAGVNLDEAVLYGERSLAIARQHDLKEQMAFTLHDLARPYALTNRFSLGLKSLEEAGTLFEELGNLPMLADNYTTLASGLYLFGQLEGGLKKTAEGLKISNQVGSLWGQAYANSIRAPILSGLGRVDEALTCWKKAILTGEKANFVATQFYARTNMALAFGFLGDVNGGLDLCNEVLSLMVKMDQYSNQPEVFIISLVLHSLNEDLESAENALSKLNDKMAMNSVSPDIASLYHFSVGKMALLRKDYETAAKTTLIRIQELKNYGWLLYLPILSGIRAQALMKLGRLKEAEPTLVEGRDAAVKMKGRLELIRILATLVEFETIRGNLTNVDQARKQGRQAIEFVSEHISEQERLHLFMNLREVRILMENGAG